MTNRRAALLFVPRRERGRREAPELRSLFNVARPKAEVRHLVRTDDRAGCDAEEFT